MWCFIDESWQQGDNEQVGVLAAAIGSKTDVEELGRHFYKVRKKYYSEENARDLRSELKGKDLLPSITTNSSRCRSRGKTTAAIAYSASSGCSGKMTTISPREGSGQKNELGSSWKEKY